MRSRWYLYLWEDQWFLPSWSVAGIWANQWPFQNLQSTRHEKNHWTKGFLEAELGGLRRGDSQVKITFYIVRASCYLPNHQPSTTSRSLVTRSDKIGRKRTDNVIMSMKTSLLPLHSDPWDPPAAGSAANGKAVAGAACKTRRSRSPRSDCANSWVIKTTSKSHTSSTYPVKKNGDVYWLPPLANKYETAEYLCI